MKKIFSVLALWALFFTAACSVHRGSAARPERGEKKFYAAGCFESRAVMINSLGLTDEQTGRIMDIDEKYEIIYSSFKGPEGRLSMMIKEHRDEIGAALTKNQRKQLLQSCTETWLEADKKQKPGSVLK